MMKFGKFAALAFMLLATACGDGESDSNTNNVNNENNMIDPAEVEWTLTAGSDVFQGTFAQKQQRAMDLGISMSGEAGTMLFTIPAQVGDLGTFNATTVQIGLVDAYDNCGWAIVNEDDVSPVTVTLTGVEGTRQVGTFTITDLECTDPEGVLLNATGDFKAR